MEARNVELIIDGYNALFSLAKLGTFKLASADSRFYLERENLIRVLSEKEGLKGYRIIVVFDGQEQQTRAERKGKLLIIYTARQETADDLIFRLAMERKIVAAIDSRFLKIALNKDITVITSDKKLRKRLKKIDSCIKTKKVSWLNLN